MPIRIEICEGPMKGRTFVLDGHDTFIFGREKDAHCRIEGDPAVSRHHFLLEVNAPSIRLRDLGSTNGVEVNGTTYGGPMAETVRGIGDPSARTVDLHDGDKVTVGKTLLAVRIEEPPTVLLRKPAGGNAPGNAVASSELKAARDEPAAPRPDIPGYEVCRLIGKGGMGAVYLARQRASGKEVALKTMLPQVAVTESSKAFFMREIAVTMNLCHPNIIRFTDSGFAGGMFYLALEFAAKGSLDDLATRSRGKLPLKTALPVMLQSLKGMAHAHAKGYVHRDLKPQNILLCEAGGKGVAKIADLGLAKNFEMAGLSGFTATGMTGGTPNYMPKEQLFDFKRATPASDVFSLGATFYRLLTGEHAYAFRQEVDPIQTILDGEVIPIRTRDSGIPASLAAIIDRALAVEPGRRFADAGQMCSALERIVAAKG